MDAEDRGLILGELRAGFRDTSSRMDTLEKKFDRIENKVDLLNRFKIKVTAIMATIVACVQVAWHYFNSKQS